jgi:hypothetical protein
MLVSRDAVARSYGDADLRVLVGDNAADIDRSADAIVRVALNLKRAR